MSLFKFVPSPCCKHIYNVFDFLLKAVVLVEFIEFAFHSTDSIKEKV